MNGDLHERLPARPESVRSLRHAVIDFAYVNGASDRKREDIALAVSEAVSNAVLHAARGDSEREIALYARREDGWLEVVVCDDGPGLVPRDDSPGAGFGLVLIRQVADQLSIESARPMPGLRLRMTFSLH